MVLVLFFSVTVLVSTEAIVFSTVAVVKCGISMVLVTLFPTTVLVSTEAIVLSTVTVVRSWERVTVLLPRFTTFVETTVWASVEGSPVLIKVLPDEAIDVLFWNGAAEASGTGKMLPDGANAVEGSLLLTAELTDGSVAVLFW